MARKEELTVIQNMFRALSNRNYVLFFFGQGISLIGTWMQRIAMSWLVYRMTNSVFLLGVIGFANQIPTFLLAPLGGVFADRWNRRTALIVTQVLSMTQALVLAILVLTDQVQIWEVVVLGAILGVVNAFDIPIRQAFVVEMVEIKEDMGNAIALNSSLVNGARLLGPSVAGILISLVGEGMCFMLNGLSYLAVIAALIAMRVAKKMPRIGDKNIWVELREGSSYALHSRPIRATLLLLSLVSLMGMPYTVLMPVFAMDILHGNANTLGFLMASTGVGALLGAAFLVSLPADVPNLRRWIIKAAGIFGIGLIAFSYTTIFALAVLALMVAGFGMMVQMAASNTVLQSIVEESKRGRIMSFYTMAFMGMAPFGSLLAGSLAHQVGTPVTIMVGGSCCIMGAVFFAREAKHL